MKMLIVVGCFFLFGMTPPETRISYRQLTWGDFRGKAPDNISSTVDAETFISESFSCKKVNGHYTFVVQCYFLPELSFVVRKSEEGLRHEQAHFTIGQIKAIRCQRDLRPLQGGDSTAYLMARRIFYEYARNEKKEQNVFESATEGGDNDGEEERWEQRYLWELEDLEYANSKDDRRK